MSEVHRLAVLSEELRNRYVKLLHAIVTWNGPGARRRCRRSERVKKVGEVDDTDISQQSTIDIKMQTTDTGLLFQSSQQLLDASNREKKIVAAEKIGNPIKLSSKVLDVVVQDQEAWTAESGWQARRVDLNVSV